MIPISKPYLGESEKRAVLSVLDSGMLAQGQVTSQLENRIASLVRSEYAIATSSGTSALYLALLACGIGESDEVITSPFTFAGTVNSILMAGAKPVFVDIEVETFNINAESIEEAITPRTKAIMPVHLYGYPCDMNAILPIAKRHGLRIVEDAAQALGADLDGRCVGSFDVGCFSMYATKNATSAEGGVITTGDKHIRDRCRLIRNHGMRERYYHETFGFNFRMSDVHAAIGVAQLDKLYETIGKRRSNAAYYEASIKSVKTPAVKEGFNHVWHQYTIRLINSGDRQERDKAVNQLKAAGVGTGIYYPVPAHKLPYLSEYGIRETTLPVAEKLAGEVISIPVHPHLTQENLEAVSYAVNGLNP